MSLTQGLGFTAEVLQLKATHRNLHHDRAVSTRDLKSPRLRCGATREERPDLAHPGAFSRRLSSRLEEARSG